MKVKFELEGFTEDQARETKQAIYDLLDSMYPDTMVPAIEADPVSCKSWQQRLATGSVNTEELQGCMTGYAIDPLESAIESTVRMMDERMASDRSPSLNVSSKLMGHLEDLLAEQLRRLTPTSDE